VRCALGASRARIVALVCREGLIVALIGSSVGLVGAAAVTRFMQSMLFGIAPLDVVSFTAAPAVLLLVAAAACLIPARRAATLSPVAALRQD
jgi:putative ABC transport system permease protein